MDEYDIKTEQALIFEAQRSLIRVIGEAQPFKVVGLLDKRKELIGSGVQPAVFAVRLKNEVDQLQKDRQLPSGAWAEIPASGQVLALKFLDQSETEKGREIAALLQTNQLFSPESSHRPSRLFAYGLSQTNADPDRQGWLVQEFIDKPYQELQKYLQTKKALPFAEALALTTAMAEVIATMHSNRVAHTDLDGPGALDHLFWDSEQSKLRLIDFGLAKVGSTGENRVKPSHTLMDQSAIGKVLFRTLSGSHIHHIKNQWQEVLASVVPQELFDQILEIIYHTVPYSSPAEIRSKYASTGKGTQRLYQDLLDIRLR